jgi:hypothetical protein
MRLVDPEGFQIARVAYKDKMIDLVLESKAEECGTVRST